MAVTTDLPLDCFDESEDEKSERLARAAAATAVAEWLSRQRDAPFCASPLRVARWQVRQRLGSESNS